MACWMIKANTLPEEEKKVCKRGSWVNARYIFFGHSNTFRRRKLPCRWLFPGPKELFLFLVDHFSHFNKKSKAKHQAVVRCQSFLGRQGTEHGWCPHQSPSKGPRHGWTSKRPTCQSLLWWAMKFLAAGDQQCTSIKVSKVWKCVFIPVWNKNQTFQMFPQTWFVFSLVVAIKTSAFRFRRSRFSFRTFSAYKLTPDTLKTFPWKCYYWGYFSARHFGLDEAAFSSNDNKSH